MLGPQEVPQRRPWVTVPGDFTVQLRIKKGRHVTKSGSNRCSLPRHLPTHQAVRANKLKCVAHKAHDRPLAKLIGDKTRNPRHSGQLLVTRKLDGHPSLACRYKPTEEDGESALQYGVSHVAGEASSARCAAGGLTDVWHVP